MRSRVGVYEYSLYETKPITHLHSAGASWIVCGYAVASNEIAHIILHYNRIGRELSTESYSE